MKNVLTLLLTNFLAGLVCAQPLMDVERNRIAIERSRAQEGFAVEDTACYKKFWVNNCLDEVRARRFDVLADLRRQEVALNDQERKAKGADQLQKIEEKATLDKQQTDADARAEALKKGQAKAEQEAQKAGALSNPQTEQAAKARANKANANNRQADNLAKLADRVQKQGMAAEEARKFAAKQSKAKARQDQNNAAKVKKAEPLPALAPVPVLPLSPER